MEQALEGTLRLVREAEAEEQQEARDVVQSLQLRGRLAVKDSGSWSCWNAQEKGQVSYTYRLQTNVSVLRMLSEYLASRCTIRQCGGVHHGSF